MAVISFCDRMNRQLLAWKAGIHEVVRGMEKMPQGECAALAPSLTLLNTLAEELNTGLVELSDQCPIAWSSRRERLDVKFARMEAALATLSERVGLSDTLAWL